MNKESADARQSECRPGGPDGALEETARSASADESADACQSECRPGGPLSADCQLLIVALYAWMARGIGSGRTRPDSRLARLLLGLGGIYFVGMATRLVLGRTLLRGSGWFDAPIPSCFHLVLAAFLLVAGHFHASAAGEAAD